MSDAVVNPSDPEGLFLVEVTTGTGKQKKVTGYAVCERVAYLSESEVGGKGKGKQAFAAINISNGYPMGGTIQSTGNSGVGNVSGPPIYQGTGDVIPPTNYQGTDNQAMPSR
jgi:hypothetical protein